MDDPALTLTTAVRNKLIASGALTALVPANSMLDASLRADVMPAIIFASSQTLQGNTLSRSDFDVYLDLHIWQVETGTVFVKQVAGLIRDALSDAIYGASLQIADVYVQSARFLRDPDGVHSHGILTLRAKVAEYA